MTILTPLMCLGSIVASICGYKCLEKIAVKLGLVFAVMSVVFATLSIICIGLFLGDVQEEVRKIDTGRSSGINIVRAEGFTMEVVGSFCIFFATAGLTVGAIQHDDDYKRSFLYQQQQQ